VRLRARRPADLLAVVPYLLGFAPTESLVALLVRGGRVLLTVRMDLPPAGPAGLVGHLQELVDQHTPSALVLVAYTAEAGRGRTVLRAGLDGLAGVRIADALLVDGRRWWSLTCTTGCCPAEGSPYEPESSPLAAAAVYAGLPVRRSRAEVAAQAAGPDPGEWDRLRGLARELRPSLRRLGSEGRLAAMAAAVVEGVADPALGDADCVRLALLARELRVRDVGCALITGEDAEQHLALWQHVVARLPPELAVAPLCLLGVAAWAAGNGTLLNCCCERIERLDPACSMGLLLADVSARALPPSFWDALGAQLRIDLGLLAG
jgi:uncharacterized protein DUF4192